MKITLIPGEAEEYAPAADIHTEIESDTDYRKRLLATKWYPNGAYDQFTRDQAIKLMNGSELDAVGAAHGLIRIHTHTCACA